MKELFIFQTFFIILVLTTILNPVVLLSGDIYSINKLFQETIYYLNTCNPDSIEIYEAKYTVNDTIYEYVLIIPKNSSYNINVTEIYVIYNTTQSSIKDKSMRKISLGSINGLLIMIRVNKTMNPIYAVINITLVNPTNSANQCSTLYVISFNQDQLYNDAVIQLKELGEKIESILNEVKTLQTINTALNNTNANQQYEHLMNIIIIAVLIVNSVLIAYLIYVFTRLMKIRYELLE